MRYQVTGALITPVVGPSGTHPFTEWVDAATRTAATFQVLGRLEDEMAAGDVYNFYVVTPAGNKMWGVDPSDDDC
jgi:hypothetical protein